MLHGLLCGITGLRGGSWCSSGWAGPALVDHMEGAPADRRLNELTLLLLVQRLLLAGPFCTCMLLL